MCAPIKPIVFCCVAYLVITSEHALGYPIDAYPDTGIKRLDFYHLAQQGIVSGRQLSSGARLGMDQIRLYGASASIGGIEADLDYSQSIKRFLGDHAAEYGVALLDLSDPDQPIYAAHNESIRANVGSVGKIVVALALYQELARRFPHDVSARETLLRSRYVVADRFIEHDHHNVPIWHVAARQLEHRPIRIGDRASLWEYLDWALSASSNAAASMVLREVILMRHFQSAYPVSVEEAEQFFANTPATTLRSLMLNSLNSVIEQNGIDIEGLRQGSFFTRYGKNRVGGLTSYGTPRDLMKLLIRMEQGLLVDAFTSRELKRMLYMTQRRIRYASHPVLNDFAVFFKSGSLYSCNPKPEIRCRKYMGNKKNLLASVAVVESATSPPELRYLVVVMSNVLGVNSAVAHQTLAMRIHRMIEKRHSEFKGIRNGVRPND